MGKQCDHMIGYFGDWNNYNSCAELIDLSDLDKEYIKNDKDFRIDVKFKYCPKCGMENKELLNE